MQALKEAAKIIKTEAVALLAKAHDVTPDAIEHALAAGVSEKLTAQFAELVNLSIAQAVKMHEAGEIKLA